VPTLDHVALAVREPDRSLSFYQELIGADGDVTGHDYGYVLRTATGMTFTLFRGEPAKHLGETHIGFSLGSAGAVHEFRDRARAAGVIELEWCAEPGYTSVKVADPDGYPVEVSWDDPLPENLT
jgi:catechol 2,3-dioxygenase-like lactoylglutathione lyase family enzyme